MPPGRRPGRLAVAHPARGRAAPAARRRQAGHRRDRPQSPPRPGRPDAITLLAARFRLPKSVLASLFGVSTTTINNAIRQTQPLLTLTGHHTEPARNQLSSLTELLRFAADAGIPVPEEIKAAC